MILKDCTRLEEVDFPIAVVSKHSAREKSIRHGHPSTLHVWWAQRPLAARRAHEILTPTFEERLGFLVVSFRAGLVPGQATPQVVAASTAASSEAKTREEVQQASGIKDRKHFREAYLEPMLARGWLERTIPDKPRSRLQKYRLTVEGEKALKDCSGEDTE